MAAGILLLGFRWSVVWSGVATLAVALVGAVFWPGLDPTSLPQAFVAGLATTAKVLYVLFGGLLLYNVLSTGGAVDLVSRFLGELEPEKESLAIGVVVGVAPFFESVTGFGVAVVISAPILLAAGFSPLRAAVLASWGQCAVPWGALGVGTVIGADLSGLSFGQLSNTSALLNLPLYPVYGLAAVFLAGGWGGVRRRAPEALLLGLAAGLGTLFTSLHLVPELSGAVGGLVASALFLAARWRRVRGLRIPARALLPYGFLLALLALANGVAPIRSLLERLGPAFTGPGLPLLVSCVFASALLGFKAATFGSAGRKTLLQWLPTAGAVLTFVAAGQVVSASGAAAILASGAAAVGGYYPLAAPLVGALGGILTGSNAASNALFMPLQIEAARGVGASHTLIAAIQNVSGSHASLLAPQRAILAATATGLLGREGEVVRKAILPVAISVAILALVGFVL